MHKLIAAVLQVAGVGLAVGALAAWSPVVGALAGGVALFGLGLYAEHR